MQEAHKIDWLSGQELAHARLPFYNLITINKNSELQTLEF